MLLIIHFANYLVKCTLAPGIQCKEMLDGGVFLKTQSCRYT